MDFNDKPPNGYFSDEDPLLEAMKRLLEALRGVPPPPDDPGKGDPSRGSPLLKAALTSAEPAELKSLMNGLVDFDQKINAGQWNERHPEARAAARAIWEQAGNIVGRAVTQPHLAREYEEALIRWRQDSEHGRASEEEFRHRYLGKLARHLLMEVVQAAAIEMLFPGIHLVLPPDNLVAAIFAAAGLGDHFGDAV